MTIGTRIRRGLVLGVSGYSRYGKAAGVAGAGPHLHEPLTPLKGDTS